MNANYSKYDNLYKQTMASGAKGWGGDCRIALGPAQVRHILEGPGVPSSGRVLELGCGEGHLCRLLAEHGYTVTGIDVSQVAVDWARSKQVDNQVRYVQADLSASDQVLDEKFDLIIDGNCLHCIVGDDRSQFLRNARTMLKDNGVFFVSSLCRKNEGPTVTVLKDREPYRTIPSPDSLMKEIGDAGFLVLSHEVLVRNTGFNHFRAFASGA
jgi:2-polyprenyl-3-methyl-5-hydroxy-6-metoxy-1,4-benzoquinol methylase